jgi:ABC-type uncharacterized transport system substrate-binding protein
MVPACMNRGLSTLVAMLAGLLIAASAAHAHPQVWVKMKSTVVYGPDGAAIGVRHVWTFDDMYSVFATQGLEQKTKGQFTREELQPLAQVNVESLKEYAFFTFAKADGKTTPFTDPVDYHLEYNSKDTVLTLFFLLPFKAPVKAKTLHFEVYDPTYFVDFEWVKKDPVALANPPVGCQCQVAKPPPMSAALAQRLAAIPVDGTVPDDFSGAQFSNKVSVKCP